MLRQVTLLIVAGDVAWNLSNDSSCTPERAGIVVEIVSLAILTYHSIRVRENEMPYKYVVMEAESYIFSHS